MNNRRRCRLAFLLMFLLASAASAAERKWDIQFARFFSNGQNPLFVYAREHDGKWIVGIGSSRHPADAKKRTYNKCYYSADLSAVPITNGEVKGRAFVHMTPDMWVPADHRPFSVEMDVDAEVTGNQNR